MGAVRAKTLADLRRRRLQTVVIAAVLFLASTAATLALNILVETREPFDQAFAAANGAHLVITYEGDVSHDALAATGSADGVTASAGPWPVVTGALAHPKGGLMMGAEFSGRPQPDGTIDAVTIESGRWWQSPGEAVLDQDTARLLDKQVGDVIQVYSSPPVTNSKVEGPGAPVDAGEAHSLTVVGIAASVSTPHVAVWMSPTDIDALSPGHAPAQQMLYRVSPAGTDAELSVAAGNITGALPATAVLGTQTYLEVRTGVNQLADLYVPVLLAFSVFALFAAMFSIANVVSGIVLTSYRSIGIMKAVGFAPNQITGILVAQILAPVIVGTAAGVVIGSLASQPIVSQTAMSFGLPSAFAVSWPVVVAVLIIAIATAVIASIGPAIRAGRLSAVGAMTRGTAPSGRPDGGRLRRLGLRLPVGLSARLGIAAGVAHPMRAAMTLGAVTMGVAAVTFSLGLNWSLLRVMDDLNRNVASPVRAELDGGSASAGEVSAVIAADPDTGHFVSIGESEVTVPRLGTIPFVGYDGDSSWLGYALINGRWSTSPGEAVAPTNVFTTSGLHVGDTVTVERDGRSVTIRLVGEIFDAPNESDDNLVIRGSFADLAALEPGIVPSRWEMAPRDGIDPATYRSGLQDKLHRAVPISLEGESVQDESFVLFLTVVGLMGLVLAAISLGGVFNTVLLETRQRTHEIGVLKTIGLAPIQVVGMVIASVVPIGLLAGLLGVPLGLAAQRLVLTYMGQVAAKTGIPASEFDVFPATTLIALLLVGLGIAAVGAFLPAQRAARAPIAPILAAD
jgi:putative ABC transport system permease protein